MGVGSRAASRCGGARCRRPASVSDSRIRSGLVSQRGSHRGRRRRRDPESAALYGQTNGLPSRHGLAGSGPQSARSRCRPLRGDRAHGLDPLGKRAGKTGTMCGCGFPRALLPPGSRGCTGSRRVRRIRRRVDLGHRTCRSAGLRRLRSGRAVRGACTGAKRARHGVGTRGRGGPKKAGAKPIDWTAGKRSPMSSGIAKGGSLYACTARAK